MNIKIALHFDDFPEKDKEKKYMNKQKTELYEFKIHQQKR